MVRSSASFFDAARIGAAVCKLGEIQVGLRQSLDDLRRCLEVVGFEPHLLGGVSVFGNVSEARVCELEAEVVQLRCELKLLREFLGLSLGS